MASSSLAEKDTTDEFTLCKDQQNSPIPDTPHVASPPLPPPHESYHVTSLRHVLNDALEYHSQLLNDTELHVARTITESSSLSDGAIYLFSRLFRRKHDQWFPVNSLAHDYHHLMPRDSTVERSIRELVSHHFLQSTTCAEKLHETALTLLPTLSLDKLKSVWRMVPSASRNQSKRTIVNEVAQLLCDYIAREKRNSDNAAHSDKPHSAPPPPPPPSKRKRVFRQSTLTNIPPATRIAKKITKTVGPAVHLTEQVISALDRLHFLVLLDEDAHTTPNFILSFTNKVRFPTYACVRETPVFPSKHALASYESARGLEKMLDEALNNTPSVRKSSGGGFEPEWLLAVEIGNLADRYVREYYELGAPTHTTSTTTTTVEHGAKLEHVPVHQDREELRSQLAHPFLKRYTSHWVYCRVLWYSISAVERVEEYEVAVERLKLLLTMPLSPKRRGRVLERLTIDLSRHLKRPKEALDIILTALRDSSDETAPLRAADSQALATRALKLHYQLHINREISRAAMTIKSKVKRIEKAKETVAELAKPIRVFVLSRDFRTTQFIRTPILVDTGSAARKRLRPTTTLLSIDSNSESTNNSSSRVWYTSLNDESLQVTVEELALEYYKTRDGGGWDGKHSEGSAFAFLFTLVLWDQLFESVADVFVSPYQDRPLDLYTDAFYTSRKESIDSRLECVRQMSVEALEQEVRSVFETHEGTIAVGVGNWTGFTVDEIATIAGGLGGESVSKICLLLAKDYAYYRSGVADLVLWKRDDDDEKCSPSCKLVEVKSENDKLSNKQIGWFSALDEFGVEVEVFQVKSKKQHN